jgi:DNA-directed RNA polymerase specialized sigma24 family protein
VCLDQQHYLLQGCSRETSPFLRAAQEEERSIARDLADRLPPAKKEAFLLALEGYTSPEIAESLGISYNNACMRLSTSKSLMKDIISDRVSD